MTDRIDVVAAVIIRDGPGETWLPIGGYDGWYEVSTTGRVRSYKHDSIRSIGRSGKATLRRMPLSKKGYHMVALCHNGHVKRLAPVHLLVLETFVGPRPPGCVARHLNGISTDNRVENLTWGTPSENMADAIRHGTATIAHKNAQARFKTVEEIMSIRQRLARGERGRYLAAEFGVAESTISRIKHRVRYNAIA